MMNPTQYSSPASALNRDGNRDSNRDSNRLAVILQLAMFGCTSVVLASADAKAFDTCMPYGHAYRRFHSVYLVVLCATIPLTCMSGFIAGCYYNTHSRCVKVMVITSALAGVIVLFGCFMWSIMYLWDCDPEQTLFYNAGFWKTTTLLQGCQHAHWPFIASYNIYRITSFTMFFVCVVGAMVGVCFACFATCSGSNRVTSSSPGGHDAHARACTR